MSSRNVPVSHPAVLANAGGVNARMKTWAALSGRVGLPEDWAEKVYEPDILGKPETIYKKPGYNPLL